MAAQVAERQHVVADLEVAEQHAASGQPAVVETAVGVLAAQHRDLALPSGQR